MKKEEERKERELAEQKIRDNQRKERNIILESLENEKKQRARQILQELTAKGFKKVGKEKIKDLEAHPEKIDYDGVIEFYQNVLKKEREQVEEDKKKKLREVELWTRALREEEKLAIEKYSREHGDKEMEQIKESIKNKYEKEIKEKRALESAKPFFDTYMED